MALYVIVLNRRFCVLQLFCFTLSVKRLQLSILLICKQVLSDNALLPSDVPPCSDVMVANDNEHLHLQQQLSEEIASRKTAELRASCLHVLLTQLHNKQVLLSCLFCKFE